MKINFPIRLVSKWLIFAFSMAALVTSSFAEKTTFSLTIPLTKIYSYSVSGQDLIHASIGDELKQVITYDRDFPSSAIGPGNRNYYPGPNTVTSSVTLNGINYPLNNPPLSLFNLASLRDNYCRLAVSSKMSITPFFGMMFIRIFLRMPKLASFKRQLPSLLGVLVTTIDCQMFPHPSLLPTSATRRTTVAFGRELPSSPPLHQV